MPKLNLKYDTHSHALNKFILLVIVCVGYFIYLNIKFGSVDGSLVSLLTWSFFVLCTPIADAGMLLDFPIRLIFGTKMIITEVIVWMFAIGVNLVVLFTTPLIYEKTLLTSLFHKILISPYPYWGIIIICFIGTFLSVLFGDELIDVISHKDRNLHHQHSLKHEMLTMFFVFVMVIAFYEHMVINLGINIV